MQYGQRKINTESWELSGMTRAAGKSGEVNRKFFAADCHCSGAITNDHPVQESTQAHIGA